PGPKMPHSFRANSSVPSCGMPRGNKSRLSLQELVKNIDPAKPVILISMFRQIIRLQVMTGNGQWKAFRKPAVDASR
ncbi:hypothetical protein, partial [Phascolarctobacterium faecium]|uniref:hypothetical protein n=1 Tax=Phascolarctobacterium faecium TaxID=33025 RepID=UPI003AB185BE